MKIPDLTGYTLDEGVSVIKKDFDSLEVVIQEYTIPDDFHRKEDIDSGVKRIVRQRINPDNHLELIVFTFNETPRL